VGALTGVGGTVGFVTENAAAPKWFTDTEAGHSERYVEYIRGLAAEGSDLAGEARFMDALMAPRSRVLDAGCGPGRVGAVLHQRGHHVVGVDVDPVLIAAAREDHPDVTWVVSDLVELDLTSLGEVEPFDAAVLAGNVLAFVAPNTEVHALRGVGRHLRSGGRAVVGFQTERYSVADFDSHLAEAGFELEQRFATWDLRPWHSDADFAVSVLLWS
jgi:SAM-dependent methyltransferase